MAKKNLTLLVVPYNEDHVREFNISRPLLRTISVASILFLCALIFYTAGYYIQLSREIRFSEIRAENTELKRQLERAQGRLSALRNRVDGLSETDRKVRAWTDQPEPGEDVRQMGVGGVSAGQPPWQGRVSVETGEHLSRTFLALDQLSREARFLEASFDSMTSILSRDEAMRRHRPSICPVPRDKRYFFSSGFSSRIHPFTGRREFHNGLDIAGHVGTSILATADGVVEKVAKDKYLGFYVAIQHGFGFRTLYGHLRSRPPLKKGQKVKRGEVIGQLGNSGRSTGPHLHYAVFVKGRAVNPWNYISDQRKLASIF